MSDVPFRCYNKGCAKTFKESENNARACTFHPGDTYFHDGYKEWTCCKKKSVDFTEFLNIKGCKIDRHTSVKPPEVDRPNPVQIPEEPIPAPREPMQRPDRGVPMTQLKLVVTASLKSALAEQLEKTKFSGEGDGENKDIIKIGDPCQNRGCSKKFEGPASDMEQCVFHPGLPVFHEGMKYYSCCQRKTSEFEEFMKQQGCERGEHLWRKTEQQLKSVPACRTDWYQTGSHVYVTFFAKNSVPEKSVVEANPVSLRVKLVFDAGKSVFEKEFHLGGIIEINASDVTMAGPKVEVKMKKAEPVSWSALELHS